MLAKRIGAGRRPGSPAGYPSRRLRSSFVGSRGARTGLASCCLGSATRTTLSHRTPAAGRRVEI